MKETDARAEIEQRLTEFFQLEDDDGTTNENVDFGFNFKDADGNAAGEIAWSDIFNVVRDSPSVRKMSDSANNFLLNGAREDVPIANSEFPILGTIALTNGDTGQAL